MSCADEGAWTVADNHHSLIEAMTSDVFLAEGAQELEYVRARERMETFIQTKDSVVDDNQRIPSRRILATE